MRKSFAVIMVAMLTISSFGLVLTSANADTQIQKLSVSMHGIINQWGEDQVFGWIHAYAVKVNLNGTYREWAKVHALWSYDKPRLNCTKPPTENVTFTFYIAHLVNTTMIHFNYSGNDLYISGLWNVAKITTSIYVDPTGAIINVTKVFEPILTNATGELRVLTPLSHMPGRFELAIDGIPMLSGIVVFWRMAYKEIRICDINDDDKVDIIDLVRIAKAYKAVPGTPFYRVEIDFNFDQRIDLIDLTTLAASIQ